MPRKSAKTQQSHKEEDNKIPLGFKLRHSLPGHSSDVISLAWSPDGAVLASGYDDGTIRLWDGQTGEHIQTLQGHSSTVFSLAWSPDGGVLASSSNDETVRLWNGRTWEPLRTLQEHSDLVFSLAWSPDGKVLALDHGATIRLRRSDES